MTNDDIILKINDDLLMTQSMMDELATKEANQQSWPDEWYVDNLAILSRVYTDANGDRVADVRYGDWVTGVIIPLAIVYDMRRAWLEQQKQH